MAASTAMSSLLDYGSDNESEDGAITDNRQLLLFNTEIQSSCKVNSAPEVVPNTALDLLQHFDLSKKEVCFNPKYEELFAPQLGPDNPYKTNQQKANKNSLSGFVESDCISDFHFESQRRTFACCGYALDPTVGGSIEEGKRFVGDAASTKLGVTVFEVVKSDRKRNRNDNASDIEGFLGPWGGLLNEERVSKPSVEEHKELEEILAKRQKKGMQADDKQMEEKTLLHIKDPYDYQGRSFMHIPQVVGVKLKSENPPDKCFIPKKLIHTWAGHAKGVAAIRWFPGSAHLLLSGGMDCKVKIWEAYNERRCVRSYIGHRQAVRDVNFNNDGTQFLSAAYDRYIKLWDTERGECVSGFKCRKMAYCVKFNPDEDKQNLFVAGTSDNKIVCWDTRSGEVVQEYDRHLGAVNSITFVDDNRRFVTTSDDKSVRIWEWGIPVEMKYIADPSMHSMPAATLSPNGKWLACQSMDNRVKIFSALDRFKLNRKKTFTGHNVAGYACAMDFSPDMGYLISGDADGEVYIWDWKTAKLFRKFKAHDNVCIAALWHPHETSKVATAGWDGSIKLWD